MLFGMDFTTFASHSSLSFISLSPPDEFIWLVKPSSPHPLLMTTEQCGWLSGHFVCLEHFRGRFHPAPAAWMHFLFTQSGPTPACVSQVRYAYINRQNAHCISHVVKAFLEHGQILVSSYIIKVWLEVQTGL